MADSEATGLEVGRAFGMASIGRRPHLPATGCRVCRRPLFSFEQADHRCRSCIALASTPIGATELGEVLTLSWPANITLRGARIGRTRFDAIGERIHVT